MLLRKSVTFYTFLKCVFVLLFFTKCARFAYFYTKNVQKPLKIIRFLRKSSRRVCIVLVLVRITKENWLFDQFSFLKSFYSLIYSLLTGSYCLSNFRFVTFLQPLMETMSSQFQALHTGMLHSMCSVRLFDLNG